MIYDVTFLQKCWCGSANSGKGTNAMHQCLPKLYLVSSRLAFYCTGLISLTVRTMMSELP